MSSSPVVERNSEAPLSNTPFSPPVLQIESLDNEGRGVGRVNGKAIFVEGALPGELVTYSVFQKRPSYELAQVQTVLKPSSNRVTPRCPHFGVCGGCAMQHVEHGAQVAAKQRVLEETLVRIGKVEPERILPPVYGIPWGYRQRARLSVKYVIKKGRLLVGFHEKKSSFVAEMQSCEILPPQISALLEPLRLTIDQLSIRERLPQVELAVGESVTVLVLRVLDPPSSDDEVLLQRFADAHGIQFWLQPKGPETAHPFYPLDAPELAYHLPEFDLVMRFRPTEFTQVNPAMNRVLVKQALNLLDPQPGERIVDLFCGLGNFSLAIARRGAHVIGIEGSKALVERAGEGAVRNGLDAQTEFRVADLFKITEADVNAMGPFDRMLIDPPRDGALELVKSLGEDSPQRIVYVSCSPSTLARDAGVLVHEKGYRLVAAGVVNMFPHTAHVESIALFEK
ncbi:MAG: 23S rRNA (uracil(1939)-C(5))-methyltransferase RlmD [Pseudomonadota bacterium]